MKPTAEQTFRDACLHVSMMKRRPATKRHVIARHWETDSKLAKRARHSLKQWVTRDAGWLRAGVSRIGTGNHTTPAIKVAYNRFYEQAAA